MTLLHNLPFRSVFTVEVHMHQKITRRNVDHMARQVQKTTSKRENFSPASVGNTSTNGIFVLIYICYYTAILILIRSQGTLSYSLHSNIDTW